MAKVMEPKILKAVYDATRKLIDQNQIPTSILQPGQTLFRIVNPAGYNKLTKPGRGGYVSKLEASKILYPADGTGAKMDSSRDENRFSGHPGAGNESSIPAASGLYLSLQQQALMNEKLEYFERGMATAKAAGNAVHPTSRFEPLTQREPSALQMEHTWGKKAVHANGPLAGQCILQFLVLQPMLVAELSPHNPGRKAFLRAIDAGMRLPEGSARGESVWNQMHDSEDCSVARGIALAVAKESRFHGLIARSVRGSGQRGKYGDNVVMFTSSSSNPVRGLRPEKAWFFDSSDGYEEFPVDR